MNRKNSSAVADISQVLLDNTLILAAYLLSCSIYKSILSANLLRSHLWLYLVFSIIFSLTMSISRMYSVTTFYYPDRIVIKTLISGAVAGMSLSTAVFMLKAVECSRLLFVFLCVFSCASVMSGRLIRRAFRSAHIGNGYTHVIFIGDSEMYKRYAKYIEKTAMKIKIDKHIYFSDTTACASEELRELIITNSSNEVILASNVGDSKNERIREILETCEELGTTVRVILDIFEMPSFNRFVSSLGPLPVVTYHNVSFDKIQLFLKAAIDIIGAAVGLITFLPIMIVTAICIKIESPGPVLFKQKRAGRNGKVFEIYKFRSMYIDAEKRKQELLAQNKIKDGLMFKIDNDPRVTKVGAIIRKSSIDELPQLINVLKRDMSLVGTRPPTLDEVEKYAPKHRRRISIMPGITGMWQVSGRSTIVDFEEVVSLDTKYIDDWSLGLDFLILFRTVGALVSRLGAS